MANRPGSRLRAVFVLGLASGLPVALTGSALLAWAGRDPAAGELWMLAWAPLAYRLLWAPLLDRFSPLASGHRRGWVLTSQLALAGLIVILAGWEHLGNAALLGPLALVVACVAATLQMAVDAYRVELLPSREVGPGAGVYVVGHQLGLIVSGGLAVGLATQLSWPGVYLAMALIMLVLSLVPFGSPEPDPRTQPLGSLEEAVALPFHDVSRREGAGEILVFLILYQISNVMAGAVISQFMSTHGIAVSDARPYRLIAGVVGALAGGFAIPWLGIYAALWTFGLLHAAANLAYWWIATTGGTPVEVLRALAFDGFTAGLALAALQAFMMGLCERRFAATQLTLFTTVAALAQFAALPAVFLLKSLGWPLFFLLCTVIALPGLLVLTRFRWWARAGGIPPLR